MPTSERSRDPNWLSEIYLYVIMTNVCLDVDTFAVFERARFARTEDAMGGLASFRVALSERLKICKPTKQQVGVHWHMLVL